MGRPGLGCALLRAAAIAAVLAPRAPLASAQAAEAVDESFFAETLYPLLHAAQCVRCHNPSGVASETRLAFPRDDAGQALVEAELDAADRIGRKPDVGARSEERRVGKEC